MSLTKFTQNCRYLVLALFSIAPLISSYAGNYPLAELCSYKTLVVHENDEVSASFIFGNCQDKFNSGVQLGRYHCESITYLKPGASNEAVVLKFKDGFSIGYPNDKVVTGRLIILNGLVDMPMNSSSCTPDGTVTDGLGMDDAEVLFDSYKHGSNFTNLKLKEITSTALDGGLTVVVLLLSTDLGTFPFTVSMNHIDRECHLSCIDQVHISLNGMCTRTLLASDVVTSCDIPFDQNRFSVVLSYPYPVQKTTYAPNKVGFDLIGQRLVYKVMENETQNSCWGYVLIEDKYPPRVQIKTSDTLPCLDDRYEDAIMLAAQGCDLRYNLTNSKVQFLSKRYEDFGCDNVTYPNFIGRVLREFRVADLWNNSGTFKDTIWLWKLRADSLYCPVDTAINCSATVLESDGSVKDILWSSRFYEQDGYLHPYPTEYSTTPKSNYTHAFPAPGIYYQIPGKPRDTIYLDHADVFNTHGKCNITYKYEDMKFPICGNSYKIRRTWLIYDWCTKLDTQCVQWFKIMDHDGPVVQYPDKIAAYVEPHHCKAGLSITPPTVLNDCALKGNEDGLDGFQFTYELVYSDPTHPGKTLVQTGGLKHNESAHIYIPAGKYYLKWVIMDPCWNTTLAEQCIWVSDLTPPTPVCDRHTVVTLDPDKCWARLAAVDFGDGSYDNCCTKVVHAVAHMDSVEYYRNYWHDRFHECLGDRFYFHKDEVNKFVEDWINCWVFSDSIDVYNCGTDSLIVRVYEACDMPDYDPHVFLGTAHQWLWFNIDDGFAAYWSNHCKENGFDGIKPELRCDYSRGDFEVLLLNPSIKVEDQYVQYDGFYYSYNRNHTYYAWSAKTYLGLTCTLNYPDSVMPIKKVYPGSLYPGEVNYLVSTSRQSLFNHVHASERCYEQVLMLEDLTRSTNFQTEPMLFYNMSIYQKPAHPCAAPVDFNWVVLGGDYTTHLACMVSSNKSLITTNSCTDNFSVVMEFVCPVSYVGFDYDKVDQSGIEIKVELASKKTATFDITNKGGFWSYYAVNEDYVKKVEFIGKVVTSGAPMEHFLIDNIVYAEDCKDKGYLNGCVLSCGISLDDGFYYVDVDINKDPLPVLIRKDSIIMQRYHFKALYTDCMIELQKDDKTPPVCIAPADVFYYCDGVPYSAVFDFESKNDKIAYTGAGFAHHICSEPDELLSYCDIDDKTDPVDTYYAPRGWCVQKPWKRSNIGTYEDDFLPKGTPAHADLECGDYYYGDKDGKGVSKWQPIYCRMWLMLDIYDLKEGEILDPLSFFGKPTITDNCTKNLEPIFKDEGSINECGVGTLLRTWTVTDDCGHTSSCHQRVTFLPRSDFEVRFPADLTLDCSKETADDTSPEATGLPIISDDDCEHIGIHFEDQVFPVFDESCFKILRKWIIIDWCTYEPSLTYRESDVIVDDNLRASDTRPCVYRNIKDNGDGYVEYLQVIRVRDLKAPTVKCEKITETCFTGEACEGEVTKLIGTATDACTAEPDIAYRWVVDPFEGKDETKFIYGTGKNLSGIFPPGKHGVTLYANDRCGNEGSCYTTFVVKDCKRPTPYCYNGVATVVMPSSGNVVVWAKDLNAGSYDNCTASDKLRFSFDARGRDSSRTYTCRNLGRVEVTIYVWDEAGNSDFCSTYLLIQPGDTACARRNEALVNGTIATEMSEPIEFVSVQMLESGQSLSDTKTGVDGKFAFDGLPMDHTYVMKVSRTDDPLNGLSTLDIVDLQKQVLGIQPLNSPYKIIAADVNNSKSISASDIVALRKIILGLDETMAGNTSWKFVPKNHVFSDPTAPWDYADPYSMPNMSDEHVIVDFVGVKIGDLNNSVKANSNSLRDLEIRQKDPLVFQVQDQQLKAGEETDIHFYAKGFTHIDGYQFSLEALGLQILDLNGGELSLNQQHFGYPRQAKNFITVSWNEPLASTVPDGKILFTAKVKALQDIDLKDALLLTSRVTNAEAYRVRDAVGLNLEFVKEGQNVQGNQFVLYQNTPNPFADETFIGFILPEKGPVTIKILDITGKTLKILQGDFDKGYHEIKVKRHDLGGQGLLYYQVESGAFSATRKMILID